MVRKLPAGLQIEDLGWALRVQERKEPAGGLSGRIVRSNPVYSGSDEHLISDATLQNRVSQLGTDVVIACACTSPGRPRFEAAELPKTNNQAFNVTGFVCAQVPTLSVFSDGGAPT